MQHDTEHSAANTINISVYSIMDRNDIQAVD